jgi:hypothetical protein
MKKFVLLLFSASFILLLIVSSSGDIMKNITRYRFSMQSVFGSDKDEYGDLFGMSYLPDFRIKNDYTSSDVAVKKYNRPRCVNLVIAGDSYLGSSYVKNSSLFCGVKNVDYLKTKLIENQVVKLVRGEKNILLVETVERDLRFYSDPNYLINKLLIKETKEGEYKKEVKQFTQVISQNTYNTKMNQNVEFNLFDYRFLTPVKEIKALLNYKFFNRISDEVCLSPDRKYLLYNITVDSSSINSSFNYVSDNEVDRIVNSFNRIYKYYKANGFDEVYFSIIPNPVTILYPRMGKYNEIITRVERHSDLRVPLIDVYNLFKATSKQIYCNADTHWNLNGFNIWLNEFNKKIEYHLK